MQGKPRPLPLPCRGGEISDGDLAGLAVGESCFLLQRDALLPPVQFRGDEEVHKEGISLLGIDELSILAVVLHTCSHTTPHGLVGSRVVAIVTRTGRGEVDIAAMLRVLGREDMVEHRQLVIVGKTSLRVTTMQFLSQFQHVVRVTALWAVDVVNEVLAGLLAGEVLTTTVTTKGQRTLTSDDIPEVGAGSVIRLVAREFSDTLKSHHLGHLGVGVQIVETILSLGEWIQQTTVRESLGHIEVFLVASDGIGISQHLVHATMLRVECLFHLLVCESCRQVDGPVTEAEEELLGLFIATIDPGIAKAGIHLMYIIKRYPRAKVSLEVALLERRPYTVAIGHTTDVTLAP